MLKWIDTTTLSSILVLYFRIRKALRGDIALSIVRIEASQKSHRGVLIWPIISTSAGPPRSRSAGSSPGKTEDDGSTTRVRVGGRAKQKYSDFTSPLPGRLHHQYAGICTGRLARP
jgi:hypothetical protein